MSVSIEPRNPAVPGTIVGTGKLLTPGGEQGPPGTVGSPGTPGSSSVTTATAGFVVPAVGSTVSVSVADASWMVVGQMLNIAAAGGTNASGALLVQSKSGNNLVLLNPTAPPAIPLASPSGAGLLVQVSGSPTDYVGGDNACHASSTLPLGPDGGYLAYVSATQLSFLPFRGSVIKINGVRSQIPSTGVIGLANTGVYVEGVANQNLTASTLYYVYVFNNGGILTGDFSVTGHSTSTTSGNVGSEIKTGDDSRTLIGLIYTNASNQFSDAPATRYVRSWVNRKRISFSATTSAAITNTSYVVLITISFVCFNDEALDFRDTGYCYNSGAYANWNALYLDGTSLGLAMGSSPGANSSTGIVAVWAQQSTEGQHKLDGRGYVSGGTMNYTLNLTGNIG